MEKKGQFILVIIFLSSFLVFVSATSITDDLHLNIQTTSSGSVVTGTFAFVFNISNNSNCAVANVVYTNSTSLTTDTRGIISYYLPDVSLDYDKQYWLCYYRDGTLIDTIKIARTPYSFMAKNISAGGIINDSNLNLAGYNLTANNANFNGNILADNFNTTGRNVYVGISAGASNIGDYVTAVGRYAGELNTQRSLSALGFLAGYDNNGRYVTAVGENAGNQNDGDFLSALGNDAGTFNTGHYMVGIGYSAGAFNTGNYSIGIGFQALTGNDGNNVIAIGYKAGLANSVADQFIVKQANVNDVPLIQGNFSSGRVDFNGRTQINVDDYPQLVFNQTGATANNRLWKMYAGTENFYGTVVNDADSSASTWLQVERTANTIDSISLLGTKFITDGATILEGATTISSSSDAVDVTGVSIIYFETSINEITIGGFANGVVGQIIHCVKSSFAHNLIIEQKEATGTQKIITPTALDITFPNYGGFTAIYVGEYWRIVSYSNS